MGGNGIGGDGDGSRAGSGEAGRAGGEHAATGVTADGGATVPGPRAPDDTAPLGTRAATVAAPGTAPGQPRHDQRMAKKRKPLWRRILVWTAGSLAFLLVGLAVAGYLYLRHLNGNIEVDDLNLGSDPLEKAEPNAAGQTPLNILLLGSDSRDSAENQELGGASHLAGTYRADVQMLLHASADRSNITVISVPRDTQVTIPECTDPETGEVYPAEESQSINLSLGHGGPGCTVATWEELTGIPIDHFMMVDFAGVVDMADAVGGVPVCVEANVHDPDSGLRLEAGETVVEGEQALQWLRTRHGFAGGSDISRARAQQMYLSNMVEELQSGTSLTNPGQLMNLAEAATSALTVDPGLDTVNSLYGLGEDLRQVPNDRVNMMTMPWLPDPDNPRNTVIPEPGAAEELFSMVREDTALDEPRGGQDTAGSEAGGADPDAPEEPAETADPAGEIRIAVQNGTEADGQLPVDGRAGEITEELHRLGYSAAAVDETPAARASTAVLYPEHADRANAEAVAEALGLPRAAVRTSPSAAGITLVIGADWPEGTSYPREEPAGSDGSGGSGGGPALDPEDIISGEDENTCMAVNPEFTW